MLRFIICNMFHRHMWRGVREMERLGLTAKKAIHCEICDGSLNIATQRANVFTEKERKPCQII